jgi:hypothetical protein
MKYLKNGQIWRIEQDEKFDISKRAKRPLATSKNVSSNSRTTLKL